jgi:hypothetical protein
MPQLRSGSGSGEAHGLPTPSGVFVQPPGILGSARGVRHPPRWPAPDQRFFLFQVPSETWTSLQGEGIVISTRRVPMFRATSTSSSGLCVLSTVYKIRHLGHGNTLYREKSRFCSFRKFGVMRFCKRSAGDDRRGSPCSRPRVWLRGLEPANGGRLGTPPSKPGFASRHGRIALGNLKQVTMARLGLVSAAGF